MAYSGGLDTSVSILWLREKYGYDVVTLTVDVGQKEDLREVETVVGPGEVKDVSHEVLKAGTKGTVTLSSQKAVGYGGDPTGRIQPSLDVELTVNGNMTILIKSIGFGSAGAIDYEVVGGP